MKKYGNLIIISAIFLAFPFFLFYGHRLGVGFGRGLALAYRSILPAIFPMAVVCAVVGEMVEFFPLPPAVTLWLQSQLCGFSLGIKTVGRAYRRGLLDKKSALSLSRCCANASPAFLINYVGAQVLHSARYGLFLWLGQFAISFLIALHEGLFNGERLDPFPSAPKAGLLAEGIASATVGCLHLTGFIAFFSALTALPYMEHTHPILEITGGIGLLKNPQLGSVGALIGFSSISVLMQNSGYLSSADLSFGPMVQSRILYTLALPAFSLGAVKHPFWALTLFLVLTLFLISFDKRKKKRYNNQKKKILIRSVL